MPDDAEVKDGRAGKAPYTPVTPNKNNDAHNYTEDRGDKA